MTLPVKPHQSLGYLPAVDGLRALAVTSVLLFHLNSTWLPGGFVGLDIFFVISGFVVTASLAHIHFASFSKLLAYFYARRLVRIMPALCVCLLTTMIVFSLFIPRSWMSDLTEKTGVSAFFGLSNIILARNNDSYFAASAEYNPFLHTWSLGVEEQFYLIFPLLLFAHGRMRASTAAEKRSLLIIVALGIISFLVCAALAFIDQKYSFYLLPSRFWELALGMVLALTFGRWRWRLAQLGETWFNLLAIVAAATLLVTFVVLPESNFPFPLALLPVLSTGLSIALVCSRQEHWAARTLASGPMLWIGLRSYSLYLWHWPVFALMRWTCGLDSLPLQLTAFAATLTLGHLSYRLVEQRVRNTSAIRTMPRGKVAWVGVGVSCLAAVCGGLLLKAQPAISQSRVASGDGWYAGLDTPILSGPANCRLVMATRPLADGKVVTWARSGCTNSGDRGRLFVIGNSHALAYSPMIREYTLNTGRETRLYFRSGCGYLTLNEPMASWEHCRRFLGDARRELLSQLHPNDILFMPLMRIDPGTNEFGNKGRVYTDAGRRKAAFAEARLVLGELSERTGALLVFEAPKPLMPSPAYRCADWYMSRNPACRNGLSIPRRDAIEARQPVMEMIARLQTGNRRIALWDPLLVLCAPDQCNAFDGHEPIFFDRHHISAHGNHMLRASFSTHMERLFGASENIVASTSPARPRKQHTPTPEST